MSEVNAIRCLSEPPLPETENTQSDMRPLSPDKVIVLPPKHPLYAQSDKTIKNCPACMTGDPSVPHKCSSKCANVPVRHSDGGQTNYTNLNFANSLSLYENSKDFISRIANLTCKENLEENCRQPEM